MTDLTQPQSREQLSRLYRDSLLSDVIPFWMKHGLDVVHGGIYTALDRDGSRFDTDKSVWFQGRSGWMFATLYNTVEARSEWLEAAQSCASFSLRHCHSPEGKMWFTVTKDGQPLRMRRYVFSEVFAAISYAAVSKAIGDKTYAEHAKSAFERFLTYSFQPGMMQPKFESTRPSKAISPLMMAIVTAQELRENLGDCTVYDKTCTQWIDWCIEELERDFLKTDHRVLMESVGLNGEILDHMEGRTLNPGHAIECAWFLMREGEIRNKKELIGMGTQILDWMWERGWDREYGGLFYFVDLFGKPVQEYWHDMKFWWPHCEAIIATLVAWKLTGQTRFAKMHSEVHDWSYGHFPDSVHGEWYGYLRRDGSVSQFAKGNMYKGPFHLPRMLWYCWKELNR
jgi:N-acylglucosamine 2-epimerase